MPGFPVWTSWSRSSASRRRPSLLSGSAGSLTNPVPGASLKEIEERLARAFPTSDTWRARLGWMTASESRLRSSHGRMGIHGASERLLYCSEVCGRLLEREALGSEVEVRRAVDHVLDQVVSLTSELALQRSLLAVCAENAAQGRRRITELEAELGRTLAVVVSERKRNESLMQDIAGLRARVEALAPYEVSAKYQLRALRRSLPQAVGKRIPGRREHGDGARQS